MVPLKCRLMMPCVAACFVSCDLPLSLRLSTILVNEGLKAQAQYILQHGLPKDDTAPAKAAAPNSSECQQAWQHL
jgi:hypothetical protein